MPLLQNTEESQKCFGLVTEMEDLETSEAVQELLHKHLGSINLGIQQKSL